VHNGWNGAATMNVALRLEKMRFLIAEMQIAFQLAEFAPDSFTSRTLALHIVMRAENFIEHARAIRNPLNIPRSSEYHITKEAYAQTFAEYYDVARDKIAAHFQDLDFSKRIEIWNAIDKSKIEYFVDGAVQIYGNLAVLGLSDFVPYVRPTVLADPVFKTELGALSLRRIDRNWVEMSSDPLAATRENTTAVFNTHPIHVRAGQVTLIKRWIVMLLPLLVRFRCFPDVGRILRASIITDFVSYCDCLVTRPVSPTAPQAMSGLNAILAREGIPAAALDEFVAKSRFGEKLDAARLLRNKVGAHLDEDDAQSMGNLLAMLDGFDLVSMLNFLDRLHEAFRVVCVEHPILRLHAADGQRVYGVTASAFPTQPYSGETALGEPSRPRKYSDDEESYRHHLRQWLDGDGNQKADGRQYFIDAIKQSEITEIIEEKEYFGQSYRLHRREYRKVYKLFEEFLSTCSLGDFSGAVELFQSLAGIDPEVLADVLARVNIGGDADKAVWVGFGLGRLASPHQSKVMELLVRLSSHNIWSVRLQALIARFNVFRRSEGLYRVNNKEKTAASFDDQLATLVDGRAVEERLIILLAVASQAAWGRPPFAGAFEADVAHLNAVIETDASACLRSEAATELQPGLRRALDHKDFVCAAAMLAQRMEGTPNREGLRQGLIEASCNGTILASTSIGSARNLAICFLLAKQYEIALQQARAVAARKPGDLKFVGTILTVLTQTPSAEGEALQEIARLKSEYILDEDELRQLGELEKELHSKLGRA
jgi:hypothetical protein